METVPLLFRPRILRSKAIFRDLKQHEFQPEEIVWLCKEMLKINPLWLFQRISSSTVSKRYNIDKECLDLWKQMYASNQDAFTQPSRCLTPPYDKYSRRNINRLCLSDGLDQETLHEILKMELERTQQRRNQKTRFYIVIKKK